MPAVNTTECILHPSKLDLDCLTCSIIVSCTIVSGTEHSETAMVGTSDFLGSKYPEIDAGTPAGSAAFVNAPRKMDKVGTSSQESKSLAEPVILRRFYVSRDFHPGEHEEKETDYPEQWAISISESLKEQARKRLPGARRARKTGRVGSPSETSAPPAIIGEDLEAFLRRVFAGTTLLPPIVSSEIIVVESPSASEEDEPISVQRLRKELQAAKDKLQTALAEAEPKKEKGRKARPQPNEKDLPASKGCGTKRSRSTESSNEEPLATKNRRSKRSRLNESSDEEEVPVTKSQTKTTNRARRS